MKRTITLLFTLTCLFFVPALKAQIVQEEALVKGCNLISIVQTPDKGYFTAGNSFVETNAHIEAIKLDSTGTAQWSEVIGGSQVDNVTCVINTADGGFALCGTTSSYGAVGYDMYIVKLSATGAIQWTRTLGGNQSDEAQRIIQTKDKGYMVFGWTGSFWRTPGNQNYFIAKLDSAGNMKWDKAIGNSTSHYSVDGATPTPDGGYMLVSTIGETSISVLKIDSMGNEVFNKEFPPISGSPLGFDLADIKTLKNGTFAIGITMFAYMENDGFFLIIDSAANIITQKYISYGPNEFLAIQSINTTNDGGFVAIGEMDYSSYPRNPTVADLMVFKLDSMANLQWESTSPGVTAFINYNNYGWNHVGLGIIQANDGGYAICGEADSVSFTQGFGGYFYKIDSEGNGCIGNTYHPRSTLITAIDTAIYLLDTIQTGGLADTGGMVWSGDVFVKGCLVTAVHEVAQQAKDVLIYPNPASQELNLEFQGINTPVKVEVFDKMGQLLLSRNISNSSKNTINVASWAPAIYFVKVVSGNYTVVKKFIKL